jgi:Domain of unknown function (DUF1877)
MGVVYCLIRTSPETVEALRGHPKAAAEFIYQEPDVYVEPKPSFLSKVFGRPKNFDNITIPARTDGDETDLDKSWHVVHYLLSGSHDRGEGPLAIIGDDLHPLADVDLGLGKPNVISEDRVQDFAHAAHGMSDDDFLKRYVPDEMPLNELYMGDVIERGDVDDIRDYALEYFHILREFVQKAAESRQALITYYS